MVQQVARPFTAALNYITLSWRLTLCSRPFPLTFLSFLCFSSLSPRLLLLHYRSSTFRDQSVGIPTVLLSASHLILPRLCLEFLSPFLKHIVNKHCSPRAAENDQLTPWPIQAHAETARRCLAWSAFRWRFSPQSLNLYVFCISRHFPVTPTPLLRRLLRRGSGGFWTKTRADLHFHLSRVTKVS